jgi:hypothetical protein
MRKKTSHVETGWSPKMIREMQWMFREAHRDPGFRARFIADYREHMAQGTDILPSNNKEIV